MSDQSTKRRMSFAAREIGTADRPLDANVLRAAAKRLDVLEFDRSGHAVLDVAVIAEMRKLYQSAGILHPRRKRHPSQLEPAE